jgi:molybdopterin molybdotransferase
VVEVNMPEFLELLPPNEAIKKMIEEVGDYQIKSETIKTENSLNRVVAKNVVANEDIPAFTRSTVDGFAVRGKDTFGSSDGMPAFFEILGEIKMGEASHFELKQGQACLIHTGGMLPDGADAVVMVEHTQYSNEREIEVYKAVPPGENVILKGEDVKTGDNVFVKGTLLRSAEIGALMALGITQIEVFKIPRIGIISTGDEVIMPEETPELGKVRDINSYVLSAIVEKFGGTPKRYPIVKDNRHRLIEALKIAYDENDLIIVTAGSSASVRDLTADCINELGSPGVLVHGINVRPGKPTILAVVNEKPIIGLPGNPVSAFVIAHMLLRKLIPVMRGENDHDPIQTISAIISINVSSAAGREDWIPVKLLDYEKDGSKMVEPIFYKSNLIFSLLSAYGLAKISPDVTGLEAFSEVDVIII